MKKATLGSKLSDSFMRLAMCASLLTSVPSLADQEKIVIDEAMLSKLALASNPRTDELAVQQTASRLNRALEKAQFGTQIFSNLNYASSNEKAVSQFSPVFKPAQLASVGARQKLSSGLALQGEVFTEQYSTADGFLDRATRVGGRVGVELDLWKNFWGRLDTLSLNSAELELTNQTLRSQIQSKQFEIEIRKLYWSMVANKMSQHLSQELVASAQKQLDDSLRRARQGAADQGEVARNRAQLESRKASLLFFDHQQNLLATQLQSLLPELAGKSLTIADVSISEQEQRVSQCIAKITSDPTLPINFSSFQKLTTLLQQIEQNAVDQSQWTDAADVKLKAQWQRSNGDKNYGNSFGDWLSDGGDGYSVALELNLPLNESLRQVATEQRQLAKLKARAESQQLQAMMISEHEKAKASLTLLLQAIQTLDRSVTQLERSLKESERKYAQARINLSTLILEQDSYFNSRLQEIDSKHQIIHLVYDYFKTFNRYPCAINSLGDAA